MRTGIYTKPSHTLGYLKTISLKPLTREHVLREKKKAQNKKLLSHLSKLEFLPYL
jgi:hypothetical protein